MHTICVEVCYFKNILLASEYQEVILETWRQLEMEQMGREESGVEGKEDTQEGYGG